ncbi:alkaline serine protease AorO, putative [Cordyceps militaris CM01]|uniref:tripeptidyl-peptidase II n=1 Tax=Cordyceps militaris (strain CM01) TaxID=983644 RepID=G3JTC1_CORMM|nr:alkaline serine protease AorO, putative [Cordyceps militaris CM01]EGX88268.1 alkaline serine protease AorO, putative [Cordyceps militaris CM01]
MKSIILLTLVLGALGFPADSHVVHEKREVPRQHYVRGEPADAATRLPVQVALKQSNLEQGAQRLYDISDPKSPNYGKHMTAQEAIDFYAADTQTINTVTSWLEKAGIPAKDISLDKTRTLININSTVQKMEKVLQTRYHVYQSRITGRDHIGVDEYSLPKEIAAFVDFVYPAVSLGQMQRRDGPAPVSGASDKYGVKEPLRALAPGVLERLSSNSQSPPANSSKCHPRSPSTQPESVGCDELITPECIRAMYKIPLENKPEYVNSLGIWETDDMFDQEDMDLFIEQYAPNVPRGTKPQLDLINGATAPVRQADGGEESLLDLQMAYPIIQPQNIILFQNRPLRRALSQIFADWASAVDRKFCKEDPNYDRRLMCGKYQPSNVMSVSYGDAEQDEPIAVVQRVCNEFMKLGTVGVTVVVSSGDTGVASRRNKCAGPHHDIFTPSFLAICPFVTAVGSTVLPKGRKVGDAEVVTDSFSPGGGFSNVFPRPAYQNAVVSNYLLRHNPNYFSYETTNGTIPTDTRGIYNRAGRAYPDVAALGDNGLVVVGGKPTTGSGTSMSAPIVAAIFNRINDVRMSAGKGPIGFANPALYAAVDRDGFFNDVTEGNQALGGIYSDRGFSACGNNGFSAVEGWDPVSGLGTPNYEEWVKYFLEL